MLFDIANFLVSMRSSGSFSTHTLNVRIRKRNYKGTDDDSVGPVKYDKFSQFCETVAFSNFIQILPIETSKNIILTLTTLNNAM